MKKNKVLFVNVILLLAYLLIGGAAINKSDLGGLIGITTLIAIHITINLIAGIALFATGKSNEGKQFLLSALVVGLIGFPTCWSIFAG